MLGSYVRDREDVVGKKFKVQHHVHIIIKYTKTQIYTTLLADNDGKTVPSLFEDYLLQRNPPSFTSRKCPHLPYVLFCDPLPNCNMHSDCRLWAVPLNCAVARGSHHNAACTTSRDRDQGQIKGSRLLSRHDQRIKTDFSWYDQRSKPPFRIT